MGRPPLQDIMGASHFSINENDDVLTTVSGYYPSETPGSNGTIDLSVCSASEARYGRLGDLLA
jgi:hypothetical protein